MCGNIAALGYQVTQINQGSSGTTSGNWATNSFSLLTNAIANFTAAKVQYVHIMLGTNDAKTGINTTPTQYLANITVLLIL